MTERGEGGSEGGWGLGVEGPARVRPTQNSLVEGQVPQTLANVSPGNNIYKTSPLCPSYPALILTPQLPI